MNEAEKAYGEWLKQLVRDGFEIDTTRVEDMIRTAFMAEYNAGFR
jgi:hypothetical protein